LKPNNEIIIAPTNQTSASFLLSCDKKIEHIVIENQIDKNSCVISIVFNYSFNI
jgi:hypothetical protein